MSKVSTINIIKSQLGEIFNNYKFYLVIAWPYIVINFFVFSNNIANTYLIILFSFVGIVSFFPAAVATHQNIILNKQIGYFDVIKNFNEFKNYFYYSLVIFLCSYLLIGGSIVFLLGVLETSSFYSAGLSLAYLIFFVVFFFAGLFFVFFVYPALAFCLPKASIGQTFKLGEIFKSTKGFRLTIFWQAWLIVGVCSILAFLFGLLMEQVFAESDWTTFSLESIVWTIVQVSIDGFAFILTVSCLSKTYIIYNESQDRSAE